MKSLYFCLLILWASLLYGQKSQPLVIGVTEEIYSEKLEESRRLNIYLPEGYKSGDTTEYPVVYLLDGGMDEDFIHVVGLYQFNSFSWIDVVPRSIIVGIVNTNRMRDFTFPTSVPEDKDAFPASGGSAKFIDFIETEIQPYIGKKYRVNGTETLIGQSLGGLLASEILLYKSEMFDKYIIISPSLWWDNASLLNKESIVLMEGNRQTVQVYIGVGKEGLTPGKNPRVMEVDANLLADKLRNSKNEKVRVSFDYLPEENHATIAHQAIFNALRKFNEGKEK